MDKTADVVAKGQYHKQQQQDHADYLRHLQELVARLASGHHLVEAEYDVASVQSGDRKQVHHTQHYRQESQDVEEPEPVPS